MERFEWTVDPAQDGLRLDKFLADGLPAMSRSMLQRLCEDGKAAVNGRSGKKNERLKTGCKVALELPDPVELDVLPENIPLDIVYEDPYLLVVNKPKGMVVHPAPGNYDGTLVNALLFHCQGKLSGINGVIRPGIVHRIDKDTSGLLMVAKTDQAHVGLSEQIQAHSFDRVYHAVVYGNLREDSGTVNAPIGRHPADRKRMAVTFEHAREAATHYRVLERYPGFTYVELRLETGRTHQIRVHMAYLGHPVAGDPVYGPKQVITQLQGQCLHAKEIGFEHPVLGQHMAFNSPLPEYFQFFLKKISQSR